jgi:hypothetical protein
MYIMICKTDKYISFKSLTIILQGLQSGGFLQNATNVRNMCEFKYFKNSILGLFSYKPAFFSFIHQNFIILHLNF